MTFTRHEDGTVTADRFPEWIAISHELLDSADGRFMRVAADRSAVLILDVPYKAAPEHFYAPDCTVFGRAVYRDPAVALKLLEIALRSTRL